MNNFSKNITLWLVIGLMMILLFNLFSQPQRMAEETVFSDFINSVEGGEVSEVTIQGRNLSGTYTDGRNFSTYAPEDPDLVRVLREKGVRIKAKPQDDAPWYVAIFISWFPMLLLIGVWIFFMRQMQGGGGKAMSFGKSKAKLLNEDDQKVTFKDVAGIEESKAELEEIIEFLKNPKKFTKLGGKIPKGVLLIGPPGTGKTLLAKAVAGEAGVPFFTISGSDFVEMFVGVGASRVRDLFAQGKKSAPCIIFIDEIDAVGRHRGAGLGGGHDEREQTLNQLLVEMDGFESNEGVILISATNRPDVLDPALLRPGRFDRQVVVPRPDVKGRKKILEVHTKDIPLADDADLGVIARGTPGFSGADLANLVNEAALLAARRDRETVRMTELDESKDKVLMGVERKSMIISEEEKESTAFHEAGHTLVAKLIPGSDPIHKVSIIPRGMALGITQQLPIDERHTYNSKALLGRIAILMGGRVAEELVLDELSTGAGNDIERATDMARKMVCEWGMSKKMGPLAFGQKEEQIFLGREFAQHKDFSEATAKAIDEEVKRIVMESYDRATKLLKDNIKYLHLLTEELLVKETLEGVEVDKVIEGAKGEVDKSKPRANGKAPEKEAAKKPAEKSTADADSEA